MPKADEAGEPGPHSAHQPAMVAVPPDPDSVQLPLLDFIRAADQGRQVWVQAVGPAFEVRGGNGAPPPQPGAARLTLPAFASALRTRYGAQAAAAALRDLQARRDGPRDALDARAVRAAIERAESLQALNDAQAELWRLEYSATLMGRRFVALCERLGIDPRALPLPRREAIDAEMGWALPGAPGSEPESAEALAARLQALLQHPLH